MRALVVGAGIGGLAAALTLRRAGLEVAVREQAPALREVGAGIQLAPNATRILERLGLRPALQVVSGSRSYSPQRCVRSAAPMMAGTVGCQPANSASASATSPVADHDSTRQSRAGTTATKFRERPPATQ